MKEENMKKVFLQIKCTQEQKDQIREFAKSEGRTMSSFVRHICLYNFNKTKDEKKD